MINELSGELDCGVKERVGRIILRDGLWEDAFVAALHSDPKIAFRASWALGWAYFESPEAMRPHAGRLLETFLVSDNSSVHREYLKIIVDMWHRRMLVMDDVWLVRIVEKSFDLLISSATPAAVKVWCMGLLYELSPLLDWIADALRDVLRGIMEGKPSAGVANKTSKLLRKLG